MKIRKVDAHNTHYPRLRAGLMSRRGFLGSLGVLATIPMLTACGAAPNLAPDAYTATLPTSGSMLITLEDGQVEGWVVSQQQEANYGQDLRDHEAAFVAECQELLGSYPKEAFRTEEGLSRIANALQIRLTNFCPSELGYDPGYQALWFDVAAVS